MRLRRPFNGLGIGLVQHGVHPAIMLQGVAPYVAEMLHLKSLTINRVAGVAGLQTISSCKLNINSLPINVIVVFLLVF
jgi:hypothetical protein